MSPIRLLNSKGGPMKSIETEAARAAKAMALEYLRQPAALEIGLLPTQTAGGLAMWLPRAVARDEGRRRSNEAAAKEMRGDGQGPPSAVGAAMAAMEAAEDSKGAWYPVDPDPDAEQRAKERFKAFLARASSKGKHFLRVIDEPTQLLSNAVHNLQTTDADFNRRREMVVARLRTLGEYREVRRPTGWRVALNRLEAEMPNFSEPIRHVRAALALAEHSREPQRIPPMLLLGPPAVGKSRFARKLAELLQVPLEVIGYDRPSAGSRLRGSDSYWSNTHWGCLFEQICLGSCANPVVMLDELDKAVSGTRAHQVDPLAELHGALEPETSRHTKDESVHITFDASMTTYITTANSIFDLPSSLLSRFEVYEIPFPAPAQLLQMAKSMTLDLLTRVGMKETHAFRREAVLALSCMDPRAMQRAASVGLGEALLDGRSEVLEDDFEPFRETGSEPALRH